MTTRGSGLIPASCDGEFETNSGLLAARRGDDINVAGTEDTIDKCVECVEDTFGECKLNKDTCANCAVRCTKDGGGNAAVDQDEYIKQLRPIQHPELTGADADAEASKMVADMFVSLRGALPNASATPSVVGGLCDISATCPRTDQYTSATTDRDHQEVAGLP
eukprot:3324192-Pyramimonas_sp.AAC.1